jgi:lysophospholipase L1-like esterase
MNWYEPDVKLAEQEIKKINYEPKTIFYGSSSIRLWESLYEDFKEYYPLNLGFGGSTLEACVLFFDRLLGPYHPCHIILYAGDNDLGDGKKPPDVFGFFKKFMKLLNTHFPGVLFSFISIKPSVARLDIIEEIRATNKLIEEFIKTGPSGHYYVNIFDSMLNSNGLPNADLLEPDGLHPSAKGYEVWKEILLAHLANLKDPIMQKTVN